MTKPEAWCWDASYLARLGVLTDGGLVVHGKLGSVVIDVQDRDGHKASAYLGWIL